MGWIKNKSEFRIATQSDFYDKIWDGPPTFVWQTSPSFSIQFTFLAIYLYLHDLALNI